MSAFATFAIGRFAIEIDSLTSAYLRTGRLHCYIRTEPQEPRRWGWYREPGSVEVDAGRLRFTVSKEAKPA